MINLSVDPIEVTNIRHINQESAGIILVKYDGVYYGCIACNADDNSWIFTSSINVSDCDFCELSILKLYNKLNDHYGKVFELEYINFNQS